MTSFLSAWPDATEEKGEVGGLQRVCSWCHRCYNHSFCRIVYRVPARRVLVFRFCIDFSLTEGFNTGSGPRGMRLMHLQKQCEKFIKDSTTSDCFICNRSTMHTHTNTHTKFCVWGGNALNWPQSVIILCVMASIQHAVSSTLSCYLSDIPFCVENKKINGALFHYKYSKNSVKWNRNSPKNWKSISGYLFLKDQQFHISNFNVCFHFTESFTSTWRRNLYYYYCLLS